MKPAKSMLALVGLNAALLAGAAVLFPQSAHGAAFFGNPNNPVNPPAPGGGGFSWGDPTAAGGANVLRWNQNQITYAFSANFTATYSATFGAAAVNAVNAAFATWQASMGINAAPGTNRVTLDGAALAAGDPRIIGFSAYDLQSVTLHEIGHVLGLAHPNDAGATNNYNLAGNPLAWTVGALPAGSQPVMWSTMVPNVSTRVLTNDDIFAAQYLYGGALTGPKLAGGMALNFTQVALTANPNIIIDVFNFNNGNTLGEAWFRGPNPPGGQSWGQLNTGYIWLNIPAPGSTLVMLIATFIAKPRRRR